MSALATKIAAASKDVGGKLSPDKRNKDQSYDYISADKLIAVCGQALAEQGIALYPHIGAHDLAVLDRGNGKARYDATVQLCITIADGETEFKADWLGIGSDYLTPDKALYKAITSGHKYFLMKLLNVGAGNEDGEHETEPASAPVQTVRAAPPAKTNGTNGHSAPPPTDEPPPFDAEFEALPSVPQERAAAQAQADSFIPTCPVCNSEMWDNREGKQNPKAPDFKCKDKQCPGDGDRNKPFAIWLPESHAKGTAAMWANVQTVYGDNADQFKTWVKERYHVTSSKDLTLTQLADIIARLRQQQPA